MLKNFYGVEDPNKQRIFTYWFFCYYYKSLEKKSKKERQKGNSGLFTKLLLKIFSFRLTNFSLLRNNNQQFLLATETIFAV